MYFATAVTLALALTANAFLCPRGTIGECCLNGIVTQMGLECTNATVLEIPVDPGSSANYECVPGPIAREDKCCKHVRDYYATGCVNPLTT